MIVIRPTAGTSYAYAQHTANMCSTRMIYLIRYKFYVPEKGACCNRRAIQAKCTVFALSNERISRCNLMRKPRAIRLRQEIGEGFHLARHKRAHVRQSLHSNRNTKAALKTHMMNKKKKPYELADIRANGKRCCVGGRFAVRAHNRH